MKIKPTIKSGTVKIEVAITNQDLSRSNVLSIEGHLNQSLISTLIKYLEEYKSKLEPLHF